MKIFNILKKGLLLIFGFIFFAFAITLTITVLYFNDYGVTQFDDTSLIIIRQEVSSDKYKKGDLVFVESKVFEKYAVGDEIFAYLVDAKDGSVSIDFGIIGEINQETKEVSFENGMAYGEKYIVGETKEIHNSIGQYLSILQSRWGFLFIILVPLFLTFVYQVYVLIVEIKYGKNELH